MTQLTSLKRAFAQDQLGKVTKLQAEIIRAQRNSEDIFKSMADDALQKRDEALAKIRNTPLQKSLSPGDNRFSVFRPEERLVIHAAFKSLAGETQKLADSADFGPAQPVQLSDEEEEVSNDEAVKAMRAAICGLVSKHFGDFPAGVVEFQKEF